VRRFLIPPALWGETIGLPALEARHAARVLRLKPGESVVIFDGMGREADARIERLTAAAGTLILLSPPRWKSPPLELVLGQGLPKADKLEAILQHGIELGLTSLWPLQLKRSVVKIPEAKRAGRLERWQRIAAEASKQCGRADVPGVTPIRRLEAFCEGFSASSQQPLGLVLHEGATAEQHLREVLRELKTPPRAVWALIGPEGGLTDEEVTVARAAGFLPVSLGPRILRTETAGLALCAIIQHVYG